MVKIASWNINSLNVRLPHVAAWLAHAQPEVLALQETKLPNERFPASELVGAGYQCVYSGQLTYNGVALLSREAVTDVVTDIPGFEDPQRRIIAATVPTTLGEIRVVNLYVVNGQEVGSAKFAYKLDWLKRITAWLKTELAKHDRMVVMGDFNIAPDDRDVHDPDAWREKILCSTPEREALKQILALGLLDTFRLFEQQERIFSWWDYRMNAFRRKMGLRIDLLLASAALARQCTASYVDVEPRRQERPSDHAPVVAEFESRAPSA